jgi:hypothetical protein
MIVSCTTTREITPVQNADDVVTSFLKSSGIPQQFQFAFEEMLKKLENQIPRTKTNQVEWTDMEAKKDKAITDIFDDLASVYKQHFTEYEMTTMTNFYLSETGQKILANNSDLNPDQQQELDEFYMSDVGRKMIRKQVVLREAIDRVTFQWSTELYGTGLSILEFDN